MDTAAYDILGRRFKARDNRLWNKGYTNIPVLFCQTGEVVTVESISTASNMDHSIVRVSHDDGNHSMGSYTYFMESFDLVVDDIVIESVDQKQLAEVSDDPR